MRAENKQRNERSLEPHIVVVRGQRVIADFDLAGLYGVSTKALNQAVKRNVSRFPDDFAFQLARSRELEVTICDFK